MIVLLHGTKINKKVQEQIMNFIDELQNTDFKILCTTRIKS